MTSSHLRLARTAVVLSAAATIALAPGANAQSALVRASSAVLDASSDTVWTIEAGSYAGLRVPLHVDAALGARGGREHFWRLTSDEGLPSGVVGWRSTSYPIPLAFRHDRRWRAITSADSSAFWTIIDGMNADFGMKLFRPATIANDDPIEVIVVDLGTMREVDGLSRVTWAPSGELFDVRVTFQDASVLHDRHVVVHEMMHALGFGHTTAWSSVVSPRDANGPVRVTAEDVAYAELAMHSRLRREWANTRQLIALAVARESSRRGADEGDGCGSELGDPVAEEPIRIRGSLPTGLLTVASDCATGGENR
ncbi:MAG TPA: hypothetical protein VGJ64_07115 [Gemmatimonadaceae bacterium]|jgi:hypothetical protein